MRNETMRLDRHSQSNRANEKTIKWIAFKPSQHKPTTLITQGRSFAEIWGVLVWRYMAWPIYYGAPQYVSDRRSLQCSGGVRGMSAAGWRCRRCRHQRHLKGGWRPSDEIRLDTSPSGHTAAPGGSWFGRPGTAPVYRLGWEARKTDQWTS